MKFFAFCAGFFRDSGATESSTRLVGILSFLTAAFLAIYMVVTGKTDVEAQVVLGQCFMAGMVALGLRKAPEDHPPAPTATLKTEVTA